MAQRSDPNNAEPKLRILEWDSGFFGLRIARADEATLSREGAEQLRESARREGIDCVYLLARGDDAPTAHAVEAAGFRLMDVRLTLRWSSPEATRAADRGEDFEIARPEDIAILKEIARTSHTNSRFYADPHFPRERCAALYETWIETSCAGEADAVLVARQDGVAIGYTSCILDAKGRGHIGLVAVAERARRQSHAAQLLRASLAWFLQHGAEQVDVITQGRNTGATRLYERSGFRLHSIGLWFHLWPGEERSVN